jgi:hypothetical protein
VLSLPRPSLSPATYSTTNTAGDHSTKCGKRQGKLDHRLGKTSASPEPVSGKKDKAHPKAGGGHSHLMCTPTESRLEGGGLIDKSEFYKLKHTLESRVSVRIKFEPEREGENKS